MWCGKSLFPVHREARDMRRRRKQVEKQSVVDCLVESKRLKFERQRRDLMKTSHYCGLTSSRRQGNAIALHHCLVIQRRTGPCPICSRASASSFKFITYFKLKYYHWSWLLRFIFKPPRLLRPPGYYCLQQTLELWKQLELKINLAFRCIGAVRDKKMFDTADNPIFWKYTIPSPLAVQALVMVFGHWFLLYNFFYWVVLNAVNRNLLCRHPQPMKQISMPTQTKANKRHGITLTAEQALQIYQSKPSFTKHNTKGQSIPVSHLFDVSPKTVLDIWNRKTWPNATCSLWSSSKVNIEITFYFLLLCVRRTITDCCSPAQASH